MAQLKGYKHTEETRQKMSESQKGNTHMLGKHHSEESKLKMSLARKGIIFTDEHKRKIGEANRNRIVSDEARLNMSLAQIGKKRSEETIEKMRKARKGKYLGESNWNWKGGRNLNNDGYIDIYNPEHPKARNGVYVLEHRLIMEQKLGRYLYPFEVIHHVNGIKDDNRIENLKLLPEVEHNKQVQKVYQENLKLKEKIKKYELSYGII